MHIHAGLVVWSAAGYRFHSTLLPREGSPQPVDDGQPVLIEAKPAGSAEMRLVDATHLLEQLPSLTGNHRRVARPVGLRQDEDDDDDYDDDI